MLPLQPERGHTGCNSSLSLQLSWVGRNTHYMCCFSRLFCACIIFFACFWHIMPHHLRGCGVCNLLFTSSVSLSIFRMLSEQHHHLQGFWVHRGVAWHWLVSPAWQWKEWGFLRLICLWCLQHIGIMQGTKPLRHLSDSDKQRVRQVKRQENNLLNSISWIKECCIKYIPVHISKEQCVTSQPHYNL